jgi:hypothetical protein
MGVSYGGLGHLLSQPLANLGDALDKKLRAHVILAKVHHMLEVMTTMKT